MALHQWNEQNRYRAPRTEERDDIEFEEGEDKGASLSPTQLGLLIGLGVFYLALVVLVLDVLQL